MDGKQGQHSQRGPLPSLMNRELCCRLATGGGTRGFFLLVKTQFSARDVTQQGRNKAVGFAVCFPETEGQMTGGK